MKKIFKVIMLCLLILPVTTFFSGCDIAFFGGDDSDNNNESVQNDIALTTGTYRLVERKIDGVDWDTDFQTIIVTNSTIDMGQGGLTYSIDENVLSFLNSTMEGTVTEVEINISMFENNQTIVMRYQHVAQVTLTSGTYDLTSRLINGESWPTDNQTIAVTSTTIDFGQGAESYSIEGDVITTNSGAKGLVTSDQATITVFEGEDIIVMEYTLQ